MSAMVQAPITVTTGVNKQEQRNNYSGNSDDDCNKKKRSQDLFDATQNDENGRTCNG